MLDGTLWWPTGFDAYQLGTDWSVNKGCGGPVDLDAYFAALPPRALTRFDLFASLAADRDTGLPSYGPLDAVFAAAQRHGQMVLPVLTSNEGACENNIFKDRAWYVSGWTKAPSKGAVSFQTWLRTAIERWRDEPALAGWEPVGEPEASVCNRKDCSWQNRSCPSDAAHVLRTFFDNVGNEIRALDDRHPIFSGLAGGDQCGIAAGDYATVGSSSGIDVLDFHDYEQDASLPGEGANSLQARLKIAQRLSKPLIVNEIGIEAGACLPVGERADRIREKIAAQRKAGTAGALLWAFVPDARAAECTFDIGPADPLWEVVRESVR